MLKCRGVGILLIRSDVLGNESSENRKRYSNLKIVKIQSVPIEIQDNTAKSIADKIDFGSILLNVNQKDLESLETIIGNNGFDKPNVKMSVYKNRRGKYKGIYLWCKADLGCCRINPMFCTTYDYNIISIDDIQVRIEPEEAF